ncbi:MAG: Hsp20/alpha crystallin family protein, partial [Ktedonobacterales bacterium]
LYDNALVVAGRRDDDSEHEGEICYHEAQVRYGPFRAEILLPAPVRQDATEATYENGFLRIRLPKVVASEPGSLRPRGSGMSAPIGGARGNLNAGPGIPLGFVATGPASASDDSSPTKRVD